MSKIPAYAGWHSYALPFTVVHAQSVDSTAGKLLNYPSRIFGKLQSRLTGLQQPAGGSDDQIPAEDGQARRAHETKADGFRFGRHPKAVCGALHSSMPALIQKLKSDTGSKNQRLSGQYQPYVDSLQGELSFLKQNPQLLNAAKAGLPAGAGNIPRQRPTISGLAVPDPGSHEPAASHAGQAAGRQSGPGFYPAAENGDQLLHRTTQQPSKSNGKIYDRIIPGCLFITANRFSNIAPCSTTLASWRCRRCPLVSRLPAYQLFMKKQLPAQPGLFKLPGGDGPGTAQAIPGLQTHGQIAQQVQNQADRPVRRKRTRTWGSGHFESSSRPSRSSMPTNPGSASSAPAVPRPTHRIFAPTIPRLNPSGIGSNTVSTSRQPAIANYYPTTTDFGASLGYRAGAWQRRRNRRGLKIGLGPD